MKQIGALKILIFLFIFVFVVFFIIFIFIVPNIKELKVAKINYMKAYNRYSNANNNLLSKEKELKKIKHNNLKIIQAFDTKFNEKSFLNFSKKYFSKAKLTKDTNTTYKKNFLEYKFNTISKISNPTVFYKFLTDINRYDNIIQTDFPIKMEAIGSDINTTFKLRVFRVKKIFKALTE